MPWTTQPAWSRPRTGDFNPPRTFYTVRQTHWSRFSHEGSTLAAFRKVKAHSSLRDRYATLNDRADRLAKRGMRFSGGDSLPLSPGPTFPGCVHSVRISIASDVAQSTFSWGLAIAQVPPDGGPAVLLHAAAGVPILSPSHRLFIQSSATSPHSTCLDEHARAPSPPPVPDSYLSF